MERHILKDWKECRQDSLDCLLFSLPSSLVLTLTLPPSSSPFPRSPSPFFSSYHFLVWLTENFKDPDNSEDSSLVSSLLSIAHPVPLVNVSLSAKVYVSWLIGDEVVAFTRVEVLDYSETEEMALRFLLPFSPLPRWFRRRYSLFILFTLHASLSFASPFPLLPFRRPSAYLMQIKASSNVLSLCDRGTKRKREEKDR